MPKGRFTVKGVSTHKKAKKVSRKGHRRSSKKMVK